MILEILFPVRERRSEPRDDFFGIRLELQRPEPGLFRIAPAPQLEVAIAHADQVARQRPTVAIDLLVYIKSLKMILPLTTDLELGFEVFE